VIEVVGVGNQTCSSSLWLVEVKAAINPSSLHFTIPEGGFHLMREGGGLVEGWKWDWWLGRRVLLTPTVDNWTRGARSRLMGSWRR
jgi:hypothetical protein